VKVSDLDYPIRKEQIAIQSVSPRDCARLLVLNREKKDWSECVFKDLTRHLRDGDGLVLNDSGVLPVRLELFQPPAKKREVLVLGKTEEGGYRVLAKKLGAGQVWNGPGGLEMKVAEKRAEGEWFVHFSLKDMDSYLDRFGIMPLPPYILSRRNELKRDLYENSDRTAYQTVYAESQGSVAAPTAGLHFTRELLTEIQQKGVEIFKVRLHLGWGSFKPIRSGRIEDHRMAREYYEMDPAVWKRMQQLKKNGGRLIAAGTSSVRVLETMTAQSAPKFSGWTDIFIHPGYCFRLVDGLVTNFHWPRSTPLFLTAAFAGGALLLEAYRWAQEHGFRFYSYGDAMLIV